MAKKLLRLKEIRYILWIDFMSKYDRMTSNNNIVITKPCHSLANIFNVFTCASNYKISRLDY